MGRYTEKLTETHLGIAPSSEVEAPALSDLVGIEDDVPVPHEIMWRDFGELARQSG